MRCDGKCGHANRKICTIIVMTDSIINHVSNVRTRVNPFFYAISSIQNTRYSFSEYVQTKQLSSYTATTNTRKSSCTRPYYDTRVNNNDWKTHELFSDGNTHSTQHITVVKSLRTDTVLYCVKNGFPNSGELLSMIGTRLCLNQEPRWPPKLPSNRSPFYDPNQGLSYRS